MICCMTIAVEIGGWLLAPPAFWVVAPSSTECQSFGMLAMLSLAKEVFALRAPRIDFPLASLLEVSYPLIDSALSASLLLSVKLADTSIAWISFRLVIIVMWICSCFSEAINWALFYEPDEESELATLSSWNETNESSERDEGGGSDLSEVSE